MSEATAAAVSALAIVENREAPSAIMRMATDVAAVTREIVKNTAMELSGRRYVKVEGWMSIAAAYGCVPSIREVTEDERGVRAVAELRRHDGTVLAAAEGFVGNDEPRWATQPAYARRGMAQTRAVSRVCRSVFAFVVVLIDSELSTTPAEEIPAEKSGAAEIVRLPAYDQGDSKLRAAGERTARTRVRFGKTKGQFLCDIDEKDLAYQLSAARRSAAAQDPKWHDANVTWLAAVEEEATRRGMS